MSGQSGEGLDAAGCEDDQEIGGVAGVAKLTGGLSQAGEGGGGEGQSVITVGSYYISPVPECHDDGRIRYGPAAGFLFAFDDKEFPDKRQQGW